MFSSSNNSTSGGNKGKRRSFFLWGSSGSLSGGQPATVTNSSTNGKPSNGSNSKTSTRPSNPKASPMKSTLDKKPINNRNPFVQSDRPATINRGKSATELNSTPRKPSSTSEKHKVSSPHDSTTATGVRNKHSSSRLTSNEKSRVSSSTSHRHTSSSHTTSSDKTRDSSSHGHTSSQTSSHPHKRTTSSSDKQKSSTSSTSSSSPKKESSREISSSSSSLKKELNEPLALSSSSSGQKPLRARRPPPPVDLSVLRNSMKQVPEGRQLEEKPDLEAKGVFPPKQLSEERVVALNYVERGLPPSTPQDVRGEREGKGEAQVSGNEFNPKQHRRQRSEAEKFEEELDYFIKEHSAVQDSPISQRGSFPEEELDREIDLQNGLATHLDPAKASNNEDLLGGLLTYVDPLKLPEASQRNRVASPPRLASPPVINPLPSVQTEPSLEPPPPLPPKEPLEPLAAVYSSPLPASGTERKSRELTETEKRKSGTSATGDEQADRFSFTDSLADNSVKSVQQVALDDTRGAAPIVSNLSYRDSMDAATYADNNNRMSRTYTNSLDRPPLMNESLHQREEDAPENPISDTASLGEMVTTSKPRTVDSEEIFSAKDFDQDSAMQPVEAKEPPPPRRKFRVVNEDRPTFYMNGFDEYLNKDNDEFDDTATHYSIRSHESAFSKGISTAPSEKSNTYVPTNLNNQSLENNPAIFGIRSGVAGLDSASEKDILKSVVSSSRTKAGSIFTGPGSLSNHQSTRSNKSNNSSTTVSSGSPKPDKSVRLVSSYVEELRLKYYRASNFLQAPPNLPVTLKQKNNLVQPKNVKVKIRTSSKQIGIKHGRAKQKLFTLETTDEDANEDGTHKASSNNNKINVDHTREFHNLLNQKASPSKRTAQDHSPSKSKGDDDLEEFLHDIPGDDAYDSDDAMAPLREGEDTADADVSRSNTVKSYFTKQEEKLQHINNSSQYEKLPTNINIQDYLDKDPISKTVSTQSGNSGLNEPFSYGQGLRVANPDSSSD
ncbi:ZYRO0F01452p [Zygosaccharomyces rouxii]|uniref:ZYRO0F01452p n=1 Tax=Zygosaccharomyces rouxii (strain ATCC 2623 / CBS 732 / NBRC 1130 / NCYC 568 / NRRL Y-229) TaxID=559307 RepID=C5DX15_ZYGRC|nr:uncharacterized protein ZYRO0F01452g [Zygosaccharomyces rouxii]KAH9199091.1 hypothetical protein LQ764DRAFT_123316 [Zygosaccharomyces rouxii]CAR28326.1 ZYRO0F01452p [Zygosaccharomyces rouxii]